MNRREFISAVGTIGLAGCSMRSEHNGSASITAPDPGWKQFRGEPQRRGYTTEDYPTNGEAVVETGIDSRSITAPILNGREAIFPTPDVIVGIDLQNYTENYRVSIDRQPTLPVAFGSGVVSLVTSRSIVGYDLNEESKVWEHSAKSTYSDAAAPAALGRHFVIQDGNRLRLVEQRTGTVVWKRAFDARVDGFAADAEMLVVNRTVKGGSELVGLNPTDGNRQWSIEIESCRFHPVIGDHIYAISEYGRLYAIDNGEVQWQVETELLNPKSISVSDGHLLVGPDVADEYVGVDKDEASVAWRKQIKFGNPAVVNHRQAFVPSSNAGLIRLDIATGTRLRTYSEVRFGDRLVPFAGGLLYTQEPDERVRFLVLDE